MKKFLIGLAVVTATISFANDSARSSESECDCKPKRGCPPPQEAIGICVGQATDSECKVTTPHGDVLNGTCKYTPDEKYFVCMPQRHMRKSRAEQ